MFSAGWGRLGLGGLLTTEGGNIGTNGDRTGIARKGHTGDKSSAPGSPRDENMES